MRDLITKLVFLYNKDPYCTIILQKKNENGNYKYVDILYALFQSAFLNKKLYKYVL